MVATLLRLGLPDGPYRSNPKRYKVGTDSPPICVQTLSLGKGIVTPPADPAEVIRAVRAKRTANCEHPYGCSRKLADLTNQLIESGGYFRGGPIPIMGVRTQADAHFSA